MKYYAVIGTGFGDEGKGMVVSSLCKTLEKPLVVRFSGGQNAGHHVVLPTGIDHVFSNFGSGTLQGVPTYWSRFCNFDPVGFSNELNALKDKGINPVIYIDLECPVTTPFDILANRLSEKKNNHGSCGVGVGKTWEREENFYSLKVRDLFYPKILSIKLGLIRDYYNLNIEVDMSSFILKCLDLKNIIGVYFFNPPFGGYKNIIFEGSQGLLLDPKIGFFPHVTRSNLSPAVIKELNVPVYDEKDLELYLVTRAYQTRHGNGPMTCSWDNKHIQNNPYEVFTEENYQGEFRKSILDLGLLFYAVNGDRFIKQSKNKTLIVTCVDLINEYSYILGDVHYKLGSLKEFLADIELPNLKKIYYSTDPYPGLKKVE